MNNPNAVKLIFALTVFSPFSIAHAQNAVVDNFGNSVIVTTRGVENAPILTLRNFVDCLKNEYMPNDPSGQNRRVSTYGNASHFSVSISNNGEKLVFNFIPSEKETLLTSIVSRDPDGSTDQVSNLDYAAGMQMINFQLASILQSCKAAAN